MGSDRIRCAARALQLFLRSLPQGCRFNIVGFGSRYEVLFEGDSSVPYTAESLCVASHHADQVTADLGGTEILQPLAFIFEQPVPDNYSRSLIVLTDGEVCNTDEVLGLVHRNRSLASVYTVGIGDSVSHHLVEGLAEAGGGAAEFVSGTERLEPKVVRQLRRASRQAGVCLTHVEWPGIVQHLSPPALGQTRGRAPRQGVASGATGHSRSGIQCRGERVVLCALLSGAAADSDACCLRIHLRHKSGQTATLVIDTVVRLEAGRRLHAAVGRVLIEDVLTQMRSAAQPTSEEMAAAEAQVVSLGTRLQIVSRYTTYVLVDRSSTVEGPDAMATVSANQSVVKPVPPPLAHIAAQLGQAEALQFHQEEMARAERDMAVTHPDRLSIAMKYSSFLRDQMGATDEACRVAREAFEDSIAELDNLSEDTYKESTLTMQMLRDNLTSWTSDDADEHQQQQKQMLSQSQPLVSDEDLESLQSLLRLQTFH
eukprot:gnl/TRDRNA2_/TRDRNA2_163512_c6_seq2.p1 gnl/TRDRNA2_/TRDRNA2_163512_c6~~gnl/TRDRNA2_/TRDRNA2_163512_c6_seq2.p1  ORF type:complete len:534 (-),score=84.05 gnl/TRDRNA2_/TRDRNA2_163512_c6_seq2:14-1465(-)